MLVTTLTKRMAEELATIYGSVGDKMPLASTRK